MHGEVYALGKRVRLADSNVFRQSLPPPALCFPSKTTELSYEWRDNTKPTRLATEEAMREEIHSGKL